MMMTLGYSLIRVRVAERRVVEWSSGRVVAMGTWILGVILMR